MTAAIQAKRDGLAGLPLPRRRWALAGLWLGMAMSALDSSIANIALPTIGRDLAVEPARTTWIVTAYQIAVVMTLLPAAALGERFGYHRVYQGGMILFILMSLGCTLAPNLEFLAACRFLQGVGAAALMGVNGAQMRLTWPSSLLSRGIGYNALVISVTTAVGPGLAGLILSVAGWPWLFLINVPAGLVAFALVQRFGPRGAPVSQHFDGRGAILNAVMFGALFLAASEAVHGGLSLWLGTMGALGVAAGLLLLRHLRPATRPLIPLDLMRVARLRHAYGASICGFAAQTCLLIALPFLLQGHKGIAIATVGLLIMPLPLGIALSSPVAGRAADKAWAGVMSAGGLALMTGVLLLMALTLPAAVPEPVIALAMALCGIGYGLFQVPNNNVMLRTAPLDRAGAAAGMLAQCRLLGQTVGVLVAATFIGIAGTGSTITLYGAALLTAAAAAFSMRR